MSASVKRYRAPEVLEGGSITEKSDVYSFGVLVCDIAKSTSRNFEKSISELRAQPKFSTKHPFSELSSCLSKDPSQRPSMNEIMTIISKIKGKYLDQKQSNASSMNSKNAMFEKGSCIGKGGSGATIFSASFDKSSCVIKVWREVDYKEGSSETWEQVKLKAEKEIQIHKLASRNSRNVVKFLAANIFDNEIQLGIEQFEKYGTLADLIKSRNKYSTFFSKKEICNFLIPVIRALRSLHSLKPPIVHRDVKSSNIFIKEDQSTKLGDFGSAIILDGEKSHYFEGTRGRVAPEILKGGQEVEYTTTVDIYSFGMLIYELLSLKVPYDECLVPQIKSFVIEGIQPEVPGIIFRNKTEYFGLISLFQNCTHLNPTERPNAREIERRLAKIKKA